MYSTSSETSTPPPDAGKYIRIGVVALIAIAAFVLVSNQAVTLFMNVEEFRSEERRVGKEVRSRWAP